MEHASRWRERIVITHFFSFGWIAGLTQLSIGFVGTWPFPRCIVLGLRAQEIRFSIGASDGAAKPWKNRLLSRFSGPHVARIETAGAGPRYHF